MDQNLQEKIARIEYIDFAKLLPKDRFSKIEDQHMEIISKGGATFFSPVSDREMVSINCFSRWEQAFQIFSNILTRVFPSKAGELIQYNHIIYTASLTFVWENVYLYEKEFLMHLSKFPNRNWAVILQQAWSMCLKDRLKGKNQEDHRNQSGKKVKINEPCRRYNKGKCTYGTGCRYEHRCSVPKCGKFGHSSHICRKRTDTSGNSEGAIATSTTTTANK